MRVLCIDGGGVFGVGPAAIIEMAGVQATIDKFDAFVGTSIGSVIAVSLAMGKNAAVSRDYFHNEMPRIFKRNAWRQRFSLFCAKYGDEGLNKSLQGIFDGAPMLACKKPVFVTAADVGSRNLKVFKSTDFNDGAWRAWEVCRAATAAETYFPAWKGLADGGVFANNPTMVGIAGVSRSLNVPLTEIEVFSIGTGDKSGYSSRVPKGKIGWGAWLIEAMLDGAADKMHEYFARSMPLKSYQRWQFIRNPEWQMDDPKCMFKAEMEWASDLAKATDALKAF